MMSAEKRNGHMFRLNKRLPDGWEAKANEDKRIYYTDHRQQATSWLPPRENWDPGSGNLPYGWESASDENNKSYFINHVAEVTTREDPREDPDYIEPPRPRDVTLHRHVQKGFGFVAGSEKPVIVRFVTEGGPSVEKLMPGDQIIRINGEEVKQSPREHVIELVRSCKHSIILTVCQPYIDNSNRRSALLTAAKKARLKSNPSRVRFADNLNANGTPTTSPSSADSYVPLMPNVLKVFLENGQTKSFKYDSTTTVKDVIDSLQEKLNISRIEHFALVLQNTRSSSHGKMLIIQEQETLQEIASRPGALQFRCLFRVVFAPKDAYDLLREDTIAFEYFYMQCCNDVVQERFASELKFDMALRLAALQIQQHTISNNLNCKQLTIKAIEKDCGLERFVPGSLLDNMRGKDMRKLLAQYLKLNQTLTPPGQKQLSALQAKLHYLKICSELKTFGSRVFMVTLLDKKTEGMVLVGPKFGVGLVANIKNYLVVPLAEFDQITGITIIKESDTMQRVDLAIHGDNNAVSLGLMDDDVENFVALVEGYHRLFTEGEQEFKKHTQTQNNNADIDTPDYHETHNVFMEPWSYIINDKSPVANGSSPQHICDFSQGSPAYEPNLDLISRLKHELITKISDGTDHASESDSEPPNKRTKSPVPILDRSKSSPFTLEMGRPVTERVKTPIPQLFGGYEEAVTSFACDVDDDEDEDEGDDDSKAAPDRTSYLGWQNGESSPLLSMDSDQSSLGSASMTCLTVADCDNLPSSFQRYIPSPLISHSKKFSVSNMEQSSQSESISDLSGLVRTQENGTKNKPKLNSSVYHKNVLQLRDDPGIEIESASDADNDSVFERGDMSLEHTPLLNQHMIGVDRGNAIERDFAGGNGTSSVNYRPVSHHQSESDSDSWTDTPQGSPARRPFTSTGHSNSSPIRNTALHQNFNGGYGFMQNGNGVKSKSTLNNTNHRHDNNHLKYEAEEQKQRLCQPSSNGTDDVDTSFGLHSPDQLPSHMYSAMYDPRLFRDGGLYLDPDIIAKMQSDFLDSMPSHMKAPKNGKKVPATAEELDWTFLMYTLRSHMYPNLYNKKTRKSKSTNDLTLIPPPKTPDDDSIIDFSSLANLPPPAFSDGMSSVLLSASRDRNGADKLSSARSSSQSALCNGMNMAEIEKQFEALRIDRNGVAQETRKELLTEITEDENDSGNETIASENIDLTNGLQEYLIVKPETIAIQNPNGYDRTKRSSLVLSAKRQIEAGLFGNAPSTKSNATSTSTSTSSKLLISASTRPRLSAPVPGYVTSVSSNVSVQPDYNPELKSSMNKSNRHKKTNGLQSQEINQNQEPFNCSFDVDIDELLESLIIPPPPSSDEIVDVAIVPSVYSENTSIVDNKSQRRANSLDSVTGLPVAREALSSVSDVSDSDSVKKKRRAPPPPPSLPPRNDSKFQPENGSASFSVEAESPSSVSEKLNEILRSIPEVDWTNLNSEHKKSCLRSQSLRGCKPVTLSLKMNGNTEPQALLSSRHNGVVRKSTSNHNGRKHNTSLSETPASLDSSDFILPPRDQFIPKDSSSPTTLYQVTPQKPFSIPRPLIKSQSMDSMVFKSDQLSAPINADRRSSQSSSDLDGKSIDSLQKSETVSALKNKLREYRDILISKKRKSHGGSSSETDSQTASVGRTVSSSDLTTEISTHQAGNLQDAPLRRSRSFSSLARLFQKSPRTSVSSDASSVSRATGKQLNKSSSQHKLTSDSQSGGNSSAEVISSDTDTLSEFPLRSQQTGKQHTIQSNADNSSTSPTQQKRKGGKEKKAPMKPLFSTLPINFKKRMFRPPINTDVNSEKSPKKRGPLKALPSSQEDLPTNRSSRGKNKLSHSLEAMVLPPPAASEGHPVFMRSSSARGHRRANSSPLQMSAKTDSNFLLSERPPTSSSLQQMMWRPVALQRSASTEGRMSTDDTESAEQAVLKYQDMPCKLNISASESDPDSYANDKLFDQQTGTSHDTNATPVEQSCSLVAKKHSTVIREVLSRSQRTDTSFHDVINDVDSLLVGMKHTLKSVPATRIEKRDGQLQACCHELLVQSSHFVKDAKRLVASAAFSPDTVLPHVGASMTTLTRMMLHCHAVVLLMQRSEEAQDLGHQVVRVATAYKSTLSVVQACTGRQLNDPHMKYLMKQATGLASLLTTLIRTLKSLSHQHPR